MNRQSKLLPFAIVAMVVAVSGCAVFDPLPTPGTHRQDGVQAALCPPASGPSHFAGDADAAIHCLDAWRAAYYGALKDHSRFRAGQELLIGSLSAKALYDGITSAGNGHHIAALGVGGALLYGNMVRRSPNPKLQVYAAGMRALSCAAIQARPLLMVKQDHQALAVMIEVQAAQLGVLSGALALGTHAGTATADDIDARNALNAMQAELNRASILRDRISQAGKEISSQVGRIVANVTEELRATEPDPASITELIKSYPQLAATFAHGYLPSTTGTLGAGGTAEARGDGARSANGAPLAAPNGEVLKCTEPWVVSQPAGTNQSPEFKNESASTSIENALFCAHRGSYELRIRLSSVAAVEQVTAAIEGCGKPEELKPRPAIALQPDVNRIDLKTGGSATISVRSAGGIPSVTLYNNSAGALAPLVLDASLGYLVVQIKATDKTTPSPALLAVTAPNGDTRQVDIVVSKPAEAGTTPKGLTDRLGDDGLLPNERPLLAKAGRIEDLQCKLGLGSDARAPRVGPKTRARIAIAREALSLPDGAAYDQDLEDALNNANLQIVCLGTGLTEDELRAKLKGG